MREARYLACDGAHKAADHARVPVTDAPPVRWKNVPSLACEDEHGRLHGPFDCSPRKEIS